eukprot:6356103-Lingulodinium_polyedra.AAC.1
MLRTIVCGRGSASRAVFAAGCASVAQRVRRGAQSEGDMRHILLRFANSEIVGDVVGLAEQ